MKICIYGAGAIGGYMAAKLAGAGAMSASSPAVRISPPCGRRRAHADRGKAAIPSPCRSAPVPIPQSWDRRTM